jgi:hypothetical protein
MFKEGMYKYMMSQLWRIRDLLGNKFKYDSDMSESKLTSEYVRFNHKKEMLEFIRMHTMREAQLVRK